MLCSTSEERVFTQVTAANARQVSAGLVASGISVEDIEQFIEVLSDPDTIIGTPVLVTVGTTRGLTDHFTAAEHTPTKIRTLHWRLGSLSASHPRSLLPEGVLSNDPVVADGEKVAAEDIDAIRHRAGCRSVSTPIRRSHRRRPSDDHHPSSASGIESSTSANAVRDLVLGRRTYGHETRVRRRRRKRNRQRTNSSVARCHGCSMLRYVR